MRSDQLESSARDSYRSVALKKPSRLVEQLGGLAEKLCGRANFTGERLPLRTLGRNSRNLDKELSKNFQRIREKLVEDRKGLGYLVREAVERTHRVS